MARPLQQVQVYSIQKKPKSARMRSSIRPPLASNAVRCCCSTPTGLWNGVQVSIDVGQRLLAEALVAAPTSSAQAALEHVRQDVAQLHGAYNDDIALVLAQIMQ